MKLAFLLPISLISILGCGARDALPISGGTGGQGGASSSTSGGPPVCIPGETIPCYGGPPGTEGIGVCKAGSRTCATDGSAFGACKGEIIPSPESCATPEDEDCNGESPSSCPPPYTLLLGERAEPLDLYVDAAGDAYVLGAFEGTLDLGNGASLVAEEPLELFLLHLASDGQIVWAKRFPFTGNILDPAVAWRGSVVARPSGVFISGAVSGAIDFGDGPLPGHAGFIARFDASGNVQWARRTGDFWQSLDVDPTGNLLVAGHPDIYTSGFVCSGQAHVFKLDPQGETVWDRNISTSFELRLYDIAVDAEGDATFVGWLMGNADIGTGKVGAESELDDSFFIGKIGADGEPLWARAFRDPSYKEGPGFAMPYYMRPSSVGDVALGSVKNGAFSVTIAKNGDAVATGLYGGSVDFGGGTVYSDSPSLAIVRLGPGGEHVFSRFAGGLAASMPPVVAIGPKGEIGVAAQGEPFAPWGSGLDFGGGKLPGGLALAELDSSGGHVTSEAFPPFAISGLCGHAIAAGGTYLTCHTQVPLTLDPQGPSVSGFFITRRAP